MDLKTKCKILIKRENAIEREDPDGTFWHTDRTLRRICQDVDQWIDNPAMVDYFTGIIDDNFNEEFYEGLIKPLSERKWTVALDNRGRVTCRNIVYLRGQLDNDYYVYVHDKVDGAYGIQYEVAINGSSELNLLPTIKQFTEELEVGKCFIVHFKDVIEFGNGRKKYCYDITEITEKEYLDGVIDAHINTFVL